MTDVEIYDLAAQVISSIAKDLNERLYARLDGRLEVTWGVEGRFNAYAESNAAVNEPPKHKICLQYELARLIYLDAEEYCNFAENEYEQENIRSAINQFIDAPTLPTCFTKEDCIRNMFCAALTWVFFHELGHLLQEHGHIRNIFGQNTGANLTIHECDADASDKLVGMPAAVSHTTEIAADFEATGLCIQELMWHFTHADIVGKDFTGEEFIGATYLFVCALSCVFYRFNGGRSLATEELPIGSHPNPMIRMEFNLPHIFEMLDLRAIREITRHNFDRKNLVFLFERAACSGMFFWLIRNAREPGIPDNFIIKGIFNTEGAKGYARTIVRTWDEIEPTVLQIRRLNSPLGLLQFTEEFRQNIA